MKQLLFSFLSLLFCVRTFANTSEYERRLQQIYEFVDSEEVLSNHPFHAPLLKIMGVMVYYGQDVLQDRIKGASLIILGQADPYSRISFSRSLEEQILAELTPEEFELAKNLALSRSKARLARLLSQASQGIRTQHTPCSTTQNTPQRTPFGYITIDNDWDPMESNSRVYGPGTHDGNTGMLRSDYESMCRDLDRFSADLEAFSRDLSDARAKSIRAQIESLETRCTTLQWDAGKNFLRALGEAMIAGVSVEFFPGALYSALESVGHFKESAKQYHESCNIREEISRIRSMENSYDKQRERDMDRRG